MYACLCRAVPEQRVREAVASGVSTISGLRETCGAGTGCGGCLPSLRRLLRDCLGTDLACTASAVLDGGSRMVLEPACAGNCAEVPEPGAAPTCAAGLGDCGSLECDDVVPAVART
ncbi:MAG TPA: (2Fe-2S)-binding protein [Acidimicrobiales bacterium]